MKAGPRGFGPRPALLESAVLPLHHGPAAAQAGLEPANSRLTDGRGRAGRRRTATPDPGRAAGGPPTRDVTARAITPPILRRPVPDVNASSSDLMTSAPLRAM